MFSTTNLSTSRSAVPTLPLHLRHAGIQFASTDGGSGALAWPINYDELYNLKGRLLTLIDATFTDPAQRKAQKDVVWQTLKAWMDDIERADATYAPPLDCDGNDPA